VSFSRLVRFASLVLAMCIALGGQLRAADLVDQDDPDAITAPVCDDFIATTASKAVEPPPLGGTLLTLPVVIGSGRLATVELFRPPQAS
jgi:hypothetical protein